MNEEVLCLYVRVSDGCQVPRERECRMLNMSDLSSGWLDRRPSMFEPFDSKQGQQKQVYARGGILP